MAPNGGAHSKKADEGGIQKPEAWESSSWDRMEATKSYGAQAGPGRLCLSEEAWEAAGSIASGGGQQRPS